METFVGGSEFEYQVFERMNDAGVKSSAFGLKTETGKIQFDKYKDYAQADNANGFSGDRGRRFSGWQRR